MQEEGSFQTPSCPNKKKTLAALIKKKKPLAALIKVFSKALMTGEERSDPKTRSSRQAECGRGKVTERVY
jgi:hypothetical protein